MSKYRRSMRDSLGREESCMIFKLYNESQDSEFKDKENIT